MSKLNKRLKQKIHERYGHRCAWCGSTKNLTVDHIKPRTHGGTDGLYNLQLLCDDCNQEKGDEYSDAEYRYIDVGVESSTNSLADFFNKE